MALACLPMPLFIYMYSRGKSAGYYHPELVLLYIGSWIAILHVARSLMRRIKPTWWSTFLIFWMVSYSFTGFQHKYYAFTEEIKLKPRDYEMHLARACMQEVVGREALITGRENVWYTGGGHYYYDLTGDIVYADSLGNRNIAGYFSDFDAVVEHNPGANRTLVKELETISSWYADSTLRLKGFYLTNNNLDISDLAMIALSPQETRQITGFACDRYHTLYQFSEDSTGSFVFSVYVCPNDTAYRIFHEHAYFVNIIPIPDMNGSINQMNADARENLVLTIMPFDAYIGRKPEYTARFKLREEIRMNRKTIKKETLLNELRQTDKTIKFYRSKEEALLKSSE